jgi:hypothetical protein
VLWSAQRMDVPGNLAIVVALPLVAGLATGAKVHLSERLETQASIMAIAAPVGLVALVPPKFTSGWHTLPFWGSSL